MNATHYMRFDDKMGKWFVELITDEGDWTLLTVDSSREDAIKSAKELSKEQTIVVLDDEAIMMFKLEDGKVTAHDYQYSMDYKAYKDWTGETLEQDEDVECSSCRDGGCIHCEPHRFIEGYRY